MMPETLRLTPSMSPIMTMTVKTPMKMPRAVRPERSLLARMASRASNRWLTGSPSLVTQRLDRVEPRRAHRRPQAEDDADDARDAESEHDARHADAGRQRRQAVDGDPEPAAEGDADGPAQQAEDHRLDEELP